VSPRHAAPPDAEFERTPPHDVAAEQCVLGGMLMSKDAISDVLEVIGPGDHYRAGHQLVHEAILGLYRQGEPADAITVANELTKRGEIARVGGAPYLHTLIASVPTAANAAHYARIVAECALRRRMIEIGTRLQQRGTDGTDAAEQLAAAFAEMAELAASEGGSGRLAELRRALLDSDALDSLPVPEPLIDGLLYRDSLAWLHGKPGNAKSLLSLDWACCIAAGLPWMGHPVSQGPVLYVIAEGASGLHARVRAWEDRARERTTVRFLPVPVQLLNGGDLGAVVALAAELKCALVVLDTQARVAAGGDENSAADMGRLVEGAEKIRRASAACVQFVHHEARAAENMRGSTALEGAATTILRVEKDGPQVKLTNPKQKDAAEAEPMTLWVVPRLHSVVVAGQPDTPTLEFRSASESKILAVLLESFGSTGASATVLREATGLASSTFHWALNRLVNDGKVQNVGSRTRTCYMPAQDQLPAGTPMTPINSNSNDSNSNPHYGVVGVGVPEPLESWPEGSIGEAAQ
jgi:hypothetical protein